MEVNTVIMAEQRAEEHTQRMDKLQPRIQITVTSNSIMPALTILKQTMSLSVVSLISGVPALVGLRLLCWNKLNSPGA